MFFLHDQIWKIEYFSSRLLLSMFFMLVSSLRAYYFLFFTLSSPCNLVPFLVIFPSLSLKFRSNFDFKFLFLNFVWSFLCEQMPSSNKGDTVTSPRRFTLLRLHPSFWLVDVSSFILTRGHFILHFHSWPFHPSFSLF